ncbi:MAG: T9SS type A sorting domain-containing protein, partial [Flavobacterium sp.]
PNFSYYPNPVQHTLSINNTSNIDEVELISVIGKSVLTKKINNTHSEIDLSNVASGFYLLKVKAEGQTKTIKIVKK